MKRKPYKPGSLLLTSLAMAKMRAIAFNEQTPRRIINTLDNENARDDDEALAQAEAKRQRKMAKRMKEA